MSVGPHARMYSTRKQSSLCYFPRLRMKGARRKAMEWLQMP